MTDKLREAAQQALTTIEAAIIALTVANEQGKITDTIWFTEFETLFDFLGSEADALRAALAEDDVKQEIETVLAQPEQEPVAAGIVWHTPLGRYFAWLINPEDIPIGARLYTTPQRREWQVLTEKEMEKLADTHLVHQPEAPEISGVFDLIRAVSEKLEEKND